MYRKSMQLIFIAIKSWIDIRKQFRHMSNLLSSPFNSFFPFSSIFLCCCCFLSIKDLQEENVATFSRKAQGIRSFIINWCDGKWVKKQQQQQNYPLRTSSINSGIESIFKSS